MHFTYKKKIFLYFLIVFTIFTIIIVAVQQNREKMYKSENFKASLNAYAEIIANYVDSHRLIADKRLDSLNNLLPLLPRGLRVWILTACNSEDLSYDIEYTPIHPLGGQYTVSVSRNGAVVAEHVDCFLANTSDYDTDKCWIRIGAYNSANTPGDAAKSYFINGKISCNVPELSFSGTDIMNLAGNVASSDETFTLTDGKLELNGATAPSGTVCDKISFTYTTTVDPGVTYTVEGYRYTGWTED